MGQRKGQTKGAAACLHAMCEECGCGPLHCLSTLKYIYTYIDRYVVVIVKQRVVTLCVVALVCRV